MTPHEINQHCGDFVVDVKSFKLVAIFKKCLKLCFDAKICNRNECLWSLVDVWATGRAVGGAGGV